MLYFSYASNMDPARLQAHVSHPKVVGLATLPEYRLVFPLFSNAWGCGVASVQPHHGDQVWGVLYEIGDDDFAKLDHDYGFRGTDDQHNVYDREQVTVELVRPDDGSIPRRIRAWAYLARPFNPSPPSRAYVDTLIRGAKHHRLPDEYVAMLSAIEVEIDEPAG